MRGNKLKFLSVELKGFIPLSFKGTEYIKLDFTENMQLVLGRNGDGKTSLLGEITVMPPENKDYKKGGYKIVKVETDEDIYTLQSRPGTPSYHSFLKGTVELNEGRTLAAQKELVKYHFGITAEIQDLLMGRVNGTSFTSMSTTSKKEWLMKLYPYDMTYVTDFYDRIRSELNFSTGAIRNINKRLADELNKKSMLGEVDEDALKVKLGEVEENRNEMMMIIGQTRDIDCPDEHLSKKQEELAQLVKVLIRNPVFKMKQIRSLDVLDALINELTETCSGMDFLLQNHNKELDTLSKKLSEQNIGQESIEELKQVEQTLKTKLAGIISQLECNPVSELHSSLLDILIKLPENVQKTFIAVSEEITTSIREIPLVDKEADSVSGYKQTQDAVRELDVFIASLEESIKRVEHRLKHLKDADKSECPSCQYRWIPGISDTQLKQLEVRCAEEKSQLSVSQGQRDKLAEYLTKYEDWYYAMIQFIRVSKNYPELNAFFKFIMIDYDIRYKGGSELCLLIPSLSSYFSLLMEQGQTTENLTVLQRKISLIEQGGMKYEMERYDTLEKIIGENIFQRRECQAKINRFTEERASIESFLLQSAKVSRLQEEILSLLSASYQYNFGQFGQRQLSILNAEKQQYNSLLMENGGLDAIIKNLQENLLALDERVEVIKILERALSPKDGFIAEMLTGFIDSFVGNMNAEISKVWTTTLIIQTCSKDDGKLTYEFPCISSEGGGMVKTVAKCSTGEQEVINYAFRRTVMRYLGFDFYPIYLDEVGANFDVFHRPRFILHVKHESESGKTGQMFMISHYATQYGVFPHAEVCALSTEGISLPEGYNKHVTFK